MRAADDSLSLWPGLARSSREIPADGPPAGSCSTSARRRRLERESAAVQELATARAGRNVVSCWPEWGLNFRLARSRAGRAGADLISITQASGLNRIDREARTRSPRPPLNCQ